MTLTRRLAFRALGGLAAALALLSTAALAQDALRVAVYPLGPQGQGGAVRTIGPETAASHGGAHMILVPPPP